MQVVLFLAADYAKRDSSGKLDVIGIFNQITASSFPAKHRTIFLVTRVVAGFGEYNTNHDVRIIFLDEDGNELGAMEGQLLIERPQSGGQAQADFILELGDVLLPKPGRYEFRLIINKDVKGLLPLDVVQGKQPEQ